VKFIEANQLDMNIINQEEVHQKIRTRIYREIKKLNSQKINDPMKKWANELNRGVLKEEVQIAKNHMKKYSLFLGIKEMQIKTTLRFHLTPMRMAAIKNTNSECW
jgi:ribonucleotide reductase beta subunit family protein with ferritin-like domain